MEFARFPRPSLLALTLSCVGCSGSSPDSAAPESIVADATVPTTKEPPRVRVLLTGFNDWKDLGEPPALWRCRDNPSCRLLVGAARSGEPSRFEGPLVARLREQAPQVEWRFATMPVTWEVFAAVPEDVDLIINMGLGVYDRFDALQLEAGAYNLRRGPDAAARALDETIDASAPTVLEAPADSEIRERIAALEGQTLAGYEVTVAAAREANSYLCNETHFRALSALHEAGEDARLREVYFLHIPYAREGDYDALADGVAELVLGLLGERAAPREQPAQKV